MNKSFDLLLEKLMENEMAISRLYQQYAESFPEDAAFWNQLSNEEILHFNWLKQLRDFAEQDKIGVRDTSLRAQAVDTSITFINSIAQKCKNDELPRLKIYTLAYDIENSMLEKKFFDAFEFAATPYRKVQIELTRETQKHRERIDEALKKIKEAG